MKFKKKFSFHTRKKESYKIRQKYPERIPVIVDQPYNPSLPTLNKHKFLVNHDMTIGQFIYTLRKRISLNPETAIFLYVSDSFLPTTNSTLLDIYYNYKDEDGFLYCTLVGENTFGH